MDVKWYGLLAALLTSVAAGVILWRAKRDTRRSVSMHVGDKRATYILFAIASTISIGLMFVFMVQWFIPTLQLPFAFALLLFIALACQLVSAWVPHTTGLPAFIHMMMANVMAVLLLPLLAFLPFSPVVPPVTAIVIGLIIGAMTLAFTSYFVVEHTRKYFLIYQIGYLVCFFIALLLATFTVAESPTTGEVKQQVIQMSNDDFKEDPHIQGAIQQQLQQQQSTPQTTGQQGVGTGGSQLLQPAPKGLQGGN